MNTIQNCITIEPYSAPAFQSSIVQAKNFKKPNVRNIPHLLTLFTNIFILCSLMLLLMSSCKKTEELTLAPNDENLILHDQNLKVAAAYYIAPNGSDAANGDFSHPFATLNKAWTVVAAGDLVYMRGGTYSFNSSQYLYNKSGTAGNLIKIWAYPGEKPIITPGSGYTATRGINIQSSNYIHFKGLEITGFTQATGSSYYFGIVAENANNNIYEQLNVHNNGFGISIGGDSGGNLILNSDFWNNSDPISNMGVNGQPWSGADGITIRTSDPNKTNTMSGCRMWWNSDDGVDLFNNNGMIIIENCWAFWNGFQPGSFTIAGDGNGFKLGSISMLDESTQLKRIVTNNLTFENRARGIEQNNSPCIMNVYNNTSFHNGARGYDFYYGTSANLIRNNISYNDYSVTIFNTQSQVDHNSWNSGVAINSSDFVNLSSAGVDGPRQSDGRLPALTFLHLVSGSDLINTGVNIGIAYNGSAPDMGAFEYASAGSNNIPSIQNQSFSVGKNSSNGTLVGNVIATDPDAGQSLAYSILSGNTNGAFAINSATGALTVATSSALNGTPPSFTLIIKVQDNGAGMLFNTAAITVTLNNVNDVNEYPVIVSQTFSVKGFSRTGTIVGTVIASDPNVGQLLNYSVIAGNTSNAFSINSATGLITVNNKRALNYSTNPVFRLTVRVKDNGTGNLNSQAIITINLRKP